MVDACEQLRDGAAKALGGCAIRWDAVGNWGGAFFFSTLTDFTTVTVMGGQGQVGVEISLAKVEGPVGVFKHLKEEEECFLSLRIVSDFVLF